MAWLSRTTTINGRRTNSPSFWKNPAAPASSSWPVSSTLPRGGDILIYGLEPEAVCDFAPFQEPKAVIDEVHQRGGVCVAAHPTRAGLGFDLGIRNLPLDAIEVASLNLKSHEQRLALRLAENLKLSPIAASDAHDLLGVGAYATEFDAVIRSVSDLRNCIKHGTFRI